MSTSSYVAYEIPLSSAPQKFNINLFGTQYILQFIYRDVSMGSNGQPALSPTSIVGQEVINIVEQYLGPVAISLTGEITINPSGALTIEPGSLFIENPFNGWCMDIYTSAEVPILCGVPLVTGLDLLTQHAYLGLGFALFVATDEAPLKRPTFANLGTTSHLYLVANPL